MTGRPGQRSTASAPKDRTLRSLFLSFLLSLFVCLIACLLLSKQNRSDESMISSGGEQRSAGGRCPAERNDGEAGRKRKTQNEGEVMKRERWREG